LNNGEGLALTAKTGGWIQREYGYQWVFGSSIVLLVAGFFYGLFFVEETKPRKSERREGFSCGEVFDCRGLMSSLAVVLKRRLGLMRAILVALVGVYTLWEVVERSERGVVVGYVRITFTWESVDEYTKFITNYLAIAQSYCILGVAVLLPFLTRYLRVPDIFLVFLAAAGQIAEFNLTLRAKESWWLYVGVIVNIFGFTVKVSLHQ